MLLRRHVRASAEHHVLEHVSEPLTIRPLIARADVIDNAQMHHRRGVQRDVENRQTVVEDFAREGNVGERLVGCVRASRLNESKDNKTADDPSKPGMQHARSPEVERQELYPQNWEMLQFESM